MLSKIYYYILYDGCIRFSMETQKNPAEIRLPNLDFVEQAKKKRIPSENYDLFPKVAILLFSPVEIQQM